MHLRNSKKQLLKKNSLNLKFKKKLLKNKLKINLIIMNKNSKNQNVFYNISKIKKE